MDILPLARQYGDRLAILINKYEFQAARNCLEDIIKRMTWLHNPKQHGSAPISDLMLPSGGSDWEHDVVDKLRDLGIDFVSQVYGKSWEQLKNLGLEDAEISWVQHHSDILQTRISGTRRDQWHE